MYANKLPRVRLFSLFIFTAACLKVAFLFFFFSVEWIVNIRSESGKHRSAEWHWVPAAKYVSTDSKFA